MLTLYPSFPKFLPTAADSRAAAPGVDDKAALIARNKAALQKRKDAAAAAKVAEDSKALPAGWIRVESRSRPGEFVYENINTEERQAWFPTEAAVEVSAAAEAGTGDAAKAALQAKNKAALAKRKAAAAAEKDAKSKLPLPTGWTRVASTSRPGETVYQNEHTGDKQAWFPDAPAMPAGATPEEIAKEAMKDKNKAALAKRKAALAAKKSEDDGKALPAGWIRVESRSRPGEFVYENTYTDERQAWFPDGPASKPLPDGWNKVESRTYPGEFVFENKHTGERQAWEPTEAAAKTEGKATKPAAAAAAAPAPAQAAAKVLCIAVAQFDYSANDPDEEIDLVAGDKIDVHHKGDNGWWVGRSHRTNVSGIFPGTYVECA